MTKLQLQNAINSNKEKAVRNQNLSASDFSGMDLRGVDFRRSILTGVNFSNCNLTDCIFVLSDISGVNFTGAIIDNCNWEEVKNAELATFKGAIYNNETLEENVTVDKLGKYQRLVSDKFIQVGCMKGNPTFWKTLDAAKLAVEVDKINPSEKSDAETWRQTHLAKTISDHEAKKPKGPK